MVFFIAYIAATS